MSDPTDTSSRPQLPTTAESASLDPHAAPEDLACLQSALEARESERRLPHSRAADADTLARLQHTELRLHRAVIQLDATRRDANAVRKHLEAEVRAARARAQQLEEELTCLRAEHEHFQVTNAELNTVLDATQWRLNDLETQAAAAHEALARAASARSADLQRMEELNSALTAQRHAFHEALSGNSELAADVASARARNVSLESAVQELQAQYAALAEARERERSDDSDTRRALQQQLEGLASECARLSEVEATLRSENLGLRDNLAHARAEAAQESAHFAAERRALSERIDTLQAEQRTRETLLGEAQHACEELQRACCAHDEEQQRALAEAATLAARIEGLQAELCAFRDEREAVEQTLLAVRAAHGESESHYRREREELLRELDQLRALHTNAVAVSDQLTNRYEEDLSQRDDRIRQLQADAARRNAEHARAQQAAVELVHRREEEWRAAQENLAHEVASLKRDLSQALQARLAAAEQITALETALEEHGRDLATLRDQAGEAARARELADSELAGARDAVDDRLRLQERCDSLDNELREVHKRAAVAEQRQQALAAQVAESESERGALSLQVHELKALTGELERECERLRRDRGSGEELRRSKADVARLEGKITELERHRTEAAQRHSAAVAGYMVELNQRSEALQARETELHKLSEELSQSKRRCEDAISELAAQRLEQSALERELAELKKAPPPKALIAEASGPAAAPPVHPAAAPAAPIRPVAATGSAQAEDLLTGPVMVIHLEESNAICEAVRAAVAHLPDVRYATALEVGQASNAEHRLLLVNLLHRAVDSLDAISSFITADTYRQDVLAYCAEGSNGFMFGMADYFSPPIDPDACVARLMESRGAIQRLLVVSENFAVVGALRNVLSRMRSSVSAALDLRQVVDLLPMVEPDVVLIDLSLPRGEGLRVVSRLRAEPKTRDLPLGILLGDGAGKAEFRQQALRAAREFPMGPSELAAALKGRLAVSTMAEVAARPRVSA